MPTDTFSISSNTDDQIVYKSAAGYPPGGSVTRSSTGTTIQIVRSLQAGNGTLMNTLLRFNTSALPDNAVISSVVLKLHTVSKNDTNSLSVVAGWYSWNETDSDYTATPETSAHTGTTIASITVGAVKDYTLSDSAGWPNISKTGLTYLRLHVTQRAADASPTGSNQVEFAAREHSTLPEPQLLVTYTLPAGDMVGGVGN